MEQEKERVYCKDCKFWCYHGFGSFYELRQSDEKGFCSHAEGMDLDLPFMPEPIDGMYKVLNANNDCNYYQKKEQPKPIPEKPHWWKFWKSRGDPND